MKRYPIVRPFAAVFAASALSACSWFHGHSDYYTKAQETRPLEVPPDLDTPPNANALIVPPAGAAGSSATATTTEVPPSGVAGVGDNELRVADTVPGTWQRVGVALDRGKLGTISARDEAAHSYTLDVTGPAHPKPESDRHWYTPVLEHLGFGEEEQTTRHLTIHVGDDPAGAHVSVAGEGTDAATADATRRVVQALRENLVTSAPAIAAAPVAAAAAPAPAAAPVATSAAASSTPPAITGASVAGADLHVADNVQSTWQRVGIALERAQIGTLSGRDENAHTYTLAFSGTVETEPAPTEHHWYTRILHPFGGGSKTEQVQRNVVVRVADDAGGARVSVEGDTSDKSTADAARRVLQVLRDRLS